MALIRINLEKIAEDSITPIYLPGVKYSLKKKMFILSCKLYFFNGISLLWKLWNTTLNVIPDEIIISHKAK
jgi:hypothetical protein